MALSPELQSTADKIAEKCKANLNRGRVSAVGIGLFAAIMLGDKILLRNRKEKNSLIYDQDLSDKWELPGGGVDIDDLAPKGDYTGTIAATIGKEIFEETGLYLKYLDDDLILLPAWLTDEDTGQVDLAFVTIIDYSQVEKTREFEEKVANRQVDFFPIETFEGKDVPNVISPRMRFLIDCAIRRHKKDNPF